MDRIIHSNLGLESDSFDKEYRDLLCGRNDTTMIINAFATPEIVPSCLDDGGVGKNVFDAGALADAYIPNDWNAPSDLLEFLNISKENPPVCVGYGSMPFSKVTAVIEALKKENTRAVFVGSALNTDEEDEWIRENAFLVTAIPYAWLLPRCSMLLCHGGAGTVHACLRAGISVVLSPLMGDQFSWAKLLEAYGLGVKAGSNLNDVTSEDYARAISQTCECKDASRRMGVTLRSKKLGVEVFADLLEKKVF